VRKLRPESIKQLRKHEFEKFCWELLRHEYRRRFEPGALELQPPAEQDWSDGGRDIQVEVFEEPRTRSHEALLPDRRMKVWYSCKTNQDDGSGRKSPNSWQKQVRKELDPPPRIVDGRTGGLVEDAEQIAQTGKQRPSEALLRMLADGGEYVVLVNVSPGAGSSEAFERELQTLFSFWIERALDCEVPNLNRKIRIRGAYHLADAYNAAPFALEPEWEQALGLDSPDFFDDWDRWSSAFARERELIDYRPDASRERALERLDVFLTAASVDEPTIRFWGAPGVGKTRLIHRALERHPALQRRVRYTNELRELERWLRGTRPEDLHDRILVVDEVPPSRASGLADSFAVAAEHSAQARLIIIGPRDLDVRPKPADFALDPLDGGVIREIIEYELRESEAQPDVVDVVAVLSEGYPLHALWLAKALAHDRAALRDPHRLSTGDEDPWLATSRVLAGPPAGDEQWERTAELRGKALLLAVLAPDEDWEGFDEALETGFAAALRVDWGELMAAARQCVQRGLLRQVGRRRRYISPANLERLILNHFFGDGPAGPPLDPRRLRERFPSHYARLLERSRIVNASEDCHRTLTGAVIDAWRRFGEEGEATTIEQLVCGLREVAYLAPNATAVALAPFVAAAGPQAIVARAGEVVRGALQHLSHRKLARHEFEAVEDALWMLAPTGFCVRSWAQLFAPASETHQPFDVRFELLRRRLGDPLAQRRSLALEGLRAALDPSFSVGHAPGWDDVEDDWLQTRDCAEFDRQLSAGWPELLRLTSDDDQSVAGGARKLCQLMGKVLGEPGWPDEEIVEALVESVGTWTSTERNELKEAIWGPEDPREEALRGVLARLGEALVPQSLEDRLVAQVGSWMPTLFSEEAPAVRGGEVEGDRALAEELIYDPEFVCEQLVWLGSKQALRAAAFAKVVGEVDEDRALLPVLVDDGLEVAPRFVAGYLAGWGNGPDGQPLDDWIARAIARREYDEVCARALIDMRGSDRRAQLLLELLERDSLSDEALLRLGYSSWATAVSTALLDALIIALAKRGDEAKLQALGLAVTRLERSAAQLDESLRLTIGELVAATAHGRLPSLAEQAWSRLLRELGVAGALSPLQGALEHAASREFVGYPHHLVRTLSYLLVAGQSAAVWQAVSGALEAGARAEAMRDFLAAAKVFEHVPCSTLLEWAGADASRARALAHFTRPTQAQLDPLVRELLCRFGDQREIMQVIEARVGALPPGVSNRARFYLQQADNARVWQCDADPKVASWARELEAGLRARANRALHDEEYERRYFG